MADTIDQQLVEYIAKSLVDDPDSVAIERSIDERGVLLQLHVAPDDLGRVIGRGGSTAKSIRTILRALSVKNDARYNLKIVDSDNPDRNSDTDKSSSVSSPAPDTNSDDDYYAQEPVVAAETPEQAAEIATQDDDPLVSPDHSEESDADKDTISRSRQELNDLRDDLDI